MTVLFRATLALALLSAACGVDILRYNAGGVKEGEYEADPTSFVVGPKRVYQGPAISGLTVGTSHRWGIEDGFAYDFPTGDGTFDVELVFAEVYGPAQGNGRRVFSIAAEDDIRVKDYDVFKAVGANREVTKKINDISVDDGALTIAFLKGSIENPFVSAISIKHSNGTDISLSDVITGQGVGTATPTNNKEFDHQSHAVAGGPYSETDFNGDGLVEVELDGTLSHSHYSNPDTQDSGRIVSYKWEKDGKVISEKPIFTAKYGVGTTNVLLTVVDQTGDAASAETQVIGLPSSAGGAYCYYYADVTSVGPKLQSNPLPVEGHSTNIINFNDDEFPYSGAEGERWAARCVTMFTATNTTQYKFGVKYRGGSVELYVNGGKKAGSVKENSDGTNTLSALVTLGAGAVPMQVIYYHDGDFALLTLLVDDEVIPSTRLGFESSTIIPTISSISSDTVNPSGGGLLQIIGTGFFNEVSITIGGASPDVTKISSTELIVQSLPSEAEAGTDEANVVVSNAAGKSNAVTLRYAATTSAGASWQQTFLKSGSGKFGIKQISSIALGPDANLYMGALSSYVYKVSVGKDLVVKSSCASPSLGFKRGILGLAFYHGSNTFRLYASTNSLFRAYAPNVAGKPEAWANGAVETLLSGCGCLCYGEKVITGLPVSGHDHGVNDLVFLDNGDLLIGVGGATNAGVNTPGNKLGGLSESPLSGAILLAKLSRGSSFNGNIKYDQYTDPETANQISGDVSVYASGLRNSYGMTLRSNGELWATDNGGNIDGYGDVSKDCTETTPFNLRMSDEVNLIEKGKYYGHPNRNRGRKDPAQCVHSNFGGGVSPKQSVVSSTNAILEYTSNAFAGDLKGELVIGKYAAAGSGIVTRYKGGSEAPIRMAEYSALRIINGLHGELIMPRVQQGFVAVLKPQYNPPSGLMMIAVSPRKGRAGKTVFVSGENFSDGVKVNFGSQSATDVKVVDEYGLFCKVPSGSGAVKVTVVLGAASSAVTSSPDFIYI